MTRYIDEFESKIQGIPCVIKVRSYYSGRPAKISGLPENCYPAEPSECEFDVFDRKGYKAEWLARKISESDMTEISDTILTRMMEQQEAHDEEEAEYRRDLLREREYGG